MSVEHLISHYGYLALFAGVFLEGETVVIAAAFAAHQGYLRLDWVVLIAFLGSLAGDEFYFFLGRYKGRGFLRKRPAWQAKAKKVEYLLERYRRLAIVGFRFLYGLRTITPFVIGMSQVKTARFVVLNAAGAFAWSLSIAVLGFLFTHAFEAALGDLKRYEHWIMAGIVAAGAVFWGVYFMRRRQVPGPA
jgi:membrane protein DedA with SNARE-associated domain